MARLTASQSFTSEEVWCLDQLLRMIVSGRDVSVIARSNEFQSVLRKVQVMKRRIETLKKTHSV